MKMAFIPPFQMLDLHKKDRVRLMLPHLTYDYRYADFFQHDNTYTILDNGANEGIEFPWAKLIDHAYVYKVDELVMPDVMGDFDQTMAKAEQFIGQYRSRMPVGMKLGFVLHGTSFDDVMTNYMYLHRNKYVFDRVDVLYLPRMLVTTSAPHIRLSLAQKIATSERLSKKIHLLGASPFNLQEGRVAVHNGLDRYIRSMDTSAPYVYALKDEYVDGDAVIKRDLNNYFNANWSPGQKIVAARNVKLMEDWVATPSPSPL